MKKQISIVIPFQKKDNQLFLWTQIRESNDELNGLREFPGGKREEGENSLEAATREVLEEVGIALREEELVLFKKYEFGSNLNISVFIFEDTQEIFEISGYCEVEKLVANPEIIPPNNLHILKDLNFAKKAQI